MPLAGRNRPRVAGSQKGSASLPRKSEEMGSLPGSKALRMRPMRGRINAKPSANATKMAINVAGIQPCFIAPDREARYPPEINKTPSAVQKAAEKPGRRAARREAVLWRKRCGRARMRSTQFHSRRKARQLPRDAEKVRR